MNPLIPFLMLMVNWSVDTTDPEVRRMITYVFMAIHVIMFGVMLYTFFRIWTSNDSHPLRVKDEYTDEMHQTTVSGYDLSKWQNLFFMKLSLPAAVGFFIASRWNTPFPLLFQCVNNPKMLYDSPLFQLYVLRKPDEGALKRPWKDASPMPEWLQKMWGQAQPDDDAAGQGGAAASKKRRKSQ